VNTQSMHKKRYIHVNICAGVEEPSPDADGILIFPNPAKGEAYIMFPKGLGGVTIVDLLDLRGSIVSRTSLSIFPGNFQFPLDISALPAGIYLVRITGDNAIYSKKLVIF